MSCSLACVLMQIKRSMRWQGVLLVFVQKTFDGRIQHS
jgi:hypothetical protein